MTFSDDAWTRTAGIRAAIDGLPFLAELEQGTLSEERFDGYLEQDARYLGVFSRVLALLGAQADDADELGFWTAGAARVVSVERRLHERRVGASDHVAMSPTCTAYTSYLVALTATAPYPVLTAGVLPCFWIYEDVGRRLRDRVGDLSGHPYADWIGTYGDEAFAATVVQARSIADRSAAAAPDAVRDRMIDAFTTAARYEYLFWDAAWRREAWPV